MDRSRFTMGCRLTELYGSPDAINHEISYDGGYRGTRVCGELRTFDGGLPLDLRIHEPCSRYGGRQGKQEVANRG